ncbi:hypothetical protein LPAF129_10500 [Ligilactobacillus pabuli]|uniref:Uncharacterized protein n=1 Tax=Ligilactobacillus pabuli TaxID=2886039 RepID=A0ABQ5JH99_9LACO|nr:hypothetical protein LPAF129_10500 [Ligilactobacillus pabuli]
MFRKYSLTKPSECIISFPTVLDIPLECGYIIVNDNNILVYQNFKNKFYKEDFSMVKLLDDYQN